MYGRARRCKQTALVKAKPGRQEWEQAPPFLRCTATSAECVQRARQGGFSIQYSTALQLKEKGNELVAKVRWRSRDWGRSALRGWEGSRPSGLFPAPSLAMWVRFFSVATLRTGRVASSILVILTTS